jgi:hypothetical protein
MPEDLNTYTLHTQKRRQGQRLTKEERSVVQEKFLKSFSMTANVRAACMQAGIERSLVYYWQEHDPSFSLRFNIAEKEANDVIRAELFRRAVQGYEKPVVSVGKVVYGQDGKPLTERVYSDSLLSLLAKARMPEFRDKQSVDLNATVNGQINSTNLISIDTRALSSDQLAKLKALALDMKGGQQ